MKKRILALALLIVMASAVFAGCGKTTDKETVKSNDNSVTAEADSADANKESKGTITIACTGTYAPYAYADGDGNAAGYDVSVMTEIANRLGYEIKWVTTSWDSLLVGLDSGKFDVVVNQLYTNDKREELYSMAKVPYNESVQNLVVSADSDIVTLEDLNGGAIATSVGSAEALLLENYLAEHKGAYKIYYLEGSANATEAIINGRALATLNDPVNQEQQIEENNLQDEIKVVGEPLEINYVYAAFQNNEEGAALRDEFDQTLLEIIKDGTLKDLSLEHLKGDYTSTVLDGVIE